MGLGVFQTDELELGGYPGGCAGTGGVSIPPDNPHHYSCTHPSIPPTPQQLPTGTLPLWDTPRLSPHPSQPPYLLWDMALGGSTGGQPGAKGVFSDWPLASNWCRLAGSGGRAGLAPLSTGGISARAGGTSGAGGRLHGMTWGSGPPAGSNGENLTGGRQPTLGGMGGGQLTPASGSSGGAPLGTGGHWGSNGSGCPGTVLGRKMWRFMGTGLRAGGLGVSLGSAKAFWSPKRMRRRWPGSVTPRRVSAWSVSVRQSHTDHSSLCWKLSTYWSRWRVASHVATGKDPPSSMVGARPQRPSDAQCISCARRGSGRHQDLGIETEGVSSGGRIGPK